MANNSKHETNDNKELNFINKKNKETLDKIQEIVDQLNKEIKESRNG